MNIEGTIRLLNLEATRLRDEAGRTTNRTHRQALKQAADYAQAAATRLHIALR